MNAQHIASLSRSRVAVEVVHETGSTNADLLARVANLDAPLLLVVVGINQTIGYPSPKEFGNGLWTVFTGLWLFAVFENAFGLTFRNSWPLFILMWGIKLVLDPFIARRFANNQPGNRHEK